MPSPPKISFQDVEVVFPTRGKSTVALQGFTLDIQPEGFTCIVGQSGCGKTTALNLVAGFIKPSSRGPARTARSSSKQIRSSPG